MEANRIHLDKETFVNLGKELCLKAEEIYFRGLKDCRKLELLCSDFYKSNQGILEVSDFDDFLYNLNFYSQRLTGGAMGVKDYWLRFLMAAFHDKQFKYLSQSDYVKKIAKDLISEYSLREYWLPNDFYNDKFILSHTRDTTSEIVLKIPYQFNKFKIDLAVRIIEEFTTSKVAGISLWYYIDETSGVWMDQEIEIALFNGEIQIFGERKYPQCPLIPLHKFQSTKFTNSREWYYEIAEFKEYVEKVIEEEGNTN